MTKKILVAIPLELLERMDVVAQAECRTRSDLVREALRRYLEQYRKNHLVEAELNKMLEATFVPDEAESDPAYLELREKHNAQERKVSEMTAH